MTSPTLPKLMQAVIFHGPGRVTVETRPVPELHAASDAIVRVRHTALCGSELHVFRGHQASPTGFIMGHEFSGTVVATGPAVRRFAPGDPVVAPFTASCGDCFYCGRGWSSRCERSALFGSPALDGAQAEYVRVPMAEATLVMAPEGVRESPTLVLMADIFPTGWFAAANGLGGMSGEEVRDATVVVLGCGPVGLCALVNAVEYAPKHLFAVDSVEARLERARELGAEPWNFQTDREGLERRVKEVTGGRGADVVIEVVGLSPALQLAFDILRPWGIISSVGVHNGEIPWNGSQAYGKNLRIQMGRCPVRSIFPKALEMLEKKQHLLDFMTDTIMPLSQAEEGYRLFDQMKVQKVIFEAGK